MAAVSWMSVSFVMFRPSFNSSHDSTMSRVREGIADLLNLRPVVQQLHVWRAMVVRAWFFFPSCWHGWLQCLRKSAVFSSWVI
jgi:hypothetical protein